MRRITKKSIIDASIHFRNRKAWQELVNLEERMEDKEDYPRPTLDWTPQKQSKKFEVGIYNFVKYNVGRFLP